MTEQQRKGIEILNKLRFNTEVWPSVVSEDDYYFLLDFIINKQLEISVPTPYPIYPRESPWIYQTTTTM